LSHAPNTPTNRRDDSIVTKRESSAVCLVRAVRRLHRNHKLEVACDEHRQLPPVHIAIDMMHVQPHLSMVKGHHKSEPDRETLVARSTVDDGSAVGGNGW
jgi:hypothetical protein